MTLRKRTLRWRDLRPILIEAGISARPSKGDDWVLTRGATEKYRVRGFCDGRDIGPQTLADIKRKFNLDAL